MVEQQRLAIVVTNPAAMIHTWKRSFPAALGDISGTSVLGRLLSTLAYAGIGKTIVLSLGDIGPIGADFGDNLNGMELCIRQVQSPAPGPLINAAMTRELADADGDILVITENLVIDFSLLTRLFNAEARNLAVVQPEADAPAGIGVLVDAGQRLSAILPERRSADPAGLSLSGLFKFEASALRSIIRHRPQRSCDDYEFFETAISLQGNPIHIMDAQPSRIMRVADAIDLVAANFAFSSFEDQFSTIEGLHGGYWRYPVDEHILLCNVHFPPPVLFERLATRLAKVMHLYPSGHREIAAQIGEMADLPPGYIAIGNGVSELIRALYGELGPVIAIPTPTFPEYHNALSADKVFCFELPRPTFDLDVDKFGHFARVKSATLAVVVNPNNPTGRLVPVPELLRLATTLRAQQCRLVIDESFIEFSRDGKDNNSVEPYLANHPNLVVLKSLGKVLGLGGVRLGYLASSDSALVTAVRSRLGLWNINGIAEYLLWILPEFRDQLSESLDRTRADIAAFERQLKAIPGFTVVPSQANFLFCRIPDDWPGARVTAEILATRYRILVRHCGYQRMMDGDRYLRLTARTAGENQRLLSALNEIGTRLLSPGGLSPERQPVSVIRSLPDRSQPPSAQRVH